MTARGAKFSEAIISRVPRWRPSSWARTAAISGSRSASGWLLTAAEERLGEVVTKNSWLGNGHCFKVRLPAGPPRRRKITGPVGDPERGRNTPVRGTGGGPAAG